MYNSIEISGSDTDTPLNVARRLSVTRPFLPPAPCKFLDCGCGAGGYISAFESIDGVEVYGLEFEQEKVRLARERGVAADRVVQGDIQNLPFGDNSFDAILLNEVLEHVPSETLALSEINRVLRPGGILLVFSPNRIYPFETHGVVLKSSRKRLPHYTPFIPWIPLGLGRKVFEYPARNYRPRELQALLQRHGFSLLRRDYVWQTFENISGAQPPLIRHFAKILRRLAFFLERVPLVRFFGISQFLALQKRSV